MAWISFAWFLHMQSQIHRNPTMSQEIGGLAQLAERVLSMHEVAGSIPAFSMLFERCCFYQRWQMRNAIFRPFVTLGHSAIPFLSNIYVFRPCTTFTPSATFLTMHSCQKWLSWWLSCLLITSSKLIKSSRLWPLNNPCLNTGSAQLNQKKAEKHCIYYTI